jgi:hypothetical protein
MEARRVSQRSAGQPGQPGQPDPSAVDTNHSPPIVSDVDRLAKPTGSLSIKGSVTPGTERQGLRVYCIRFIRLLLVRVI